MKSPKHVHLGIMFRREYAPETLPAFALRAEEAGFDELWIVEDCFYNSGIAASATALACTQTLQVGLGIMPAVVRNPVFAAMEIATLARIFPGRFLPGLGHGVADWMRQIGAFPKSQLNALEEVTFSIRKLLHGEQVTFDGQHVHLDQAQLVHPPAQVPPISLGVINPKSLSISGRAADGTILSEYASPAYVSWAQGQIAQARPKGLQKQRISVFAFACASSTTAEAHQRLRPLVASAIASGYIDTKLVPMGILPQVQELRSKGEAYLEANMPGDWIDQLSIAGTPEDWKAAIQRLVDLGIDSIILVPLPDTGPEEIESFARRLDL